MSRAVVAQGFSLDRTGGHCAASGVAHDDKRTLSGSLALPGTIVLAARK